MNFSSYAPKRRGASNARTRYSAPMSDTPNPPSSQPVNRATLLAALRWQLEMGADEVMVADPQDRRGAQPSTPEQPQMAARKAGTMREVPNPGALKPQNAPAPAPARPAADNIGASSEIAQNAREIAANAESLEALEAALQSFDECPLKKTAKNLVFADGNPAAKIMLVGEAPGRDEDIEGRPFMGPSGQLLDKMLAAIGLDRTNVYIGNCVQWRPPGNRKPTEAEKAICLPFITRQIELVDPAILIFVGGTSAQTFLNTTEGITRLRGRWREYTPASTGTAIPAMPIFHPAFLLRTPARKKETWADLLSVKEKMTTVGLNG